MEISEDKFIEVLRQVNELLEAISEGRERWNNTSVNQERVNRFLDALTTDVGNMKKTLES